MEPIRVRFLYVNLDPPDHREFFGALLRQSMFVQSWGELIATPGSTSQTITLRTSPQNMAMEIDSMDFGELEVFVEEVSQGSLEIEIWKKNP